MLSIVIPTYNEQKFLKKLLTSIKSQDMDCEIIVSDSSTDKTRQIAKSFDCRIIAGGIPPKARNNGARIADHDLLFLDADVILPQGFLKEFINDSKGFDVTTCFVRPTDNKLAHKLYYFFKNHLNYFYPIPHCSGQCIYIKKSVFDSIGGYDESLILGEEHDLLQRALKNKASFKFFSNTYVFNSPRRIKKEGLLGLAFKSLYSEIYRLFKPVRKKIFDYDYNH